MSKKLTYIFILLSFCVYSQKDSIPKFNNFTTAEILLGKALETNAGFPKVGLESALLLNFGKNNLNNDDEWVYRLRRPQTGMTFSLTDLGNHEHLGYVFSVLPFIEYGLLKKHLRGLSMHLGIGASYFTHTYRNIPFALNAAPENNSRAVSTKVTWAFRMFFNYNIFNEKYANWKAGFGVFHHSNGHTNLPNLGLNSVLFSISRQSNYNNKKPEINNEVDFVKKEFKKNRQDYYSVRFGLGVNTLSEEINTKKGVYNVAASYGRILNKTFKFEAGLYYRFYQNYYDYIKNKGEIVVEEHPHFMEDPVRYASNFGVYLSSEFLLGHIGLELSAAYNIYKPFYEVEWVLSKGVYWASNPTDGSAPEINYYYGETTSYYKIKRAIAARLGLKYYFITTEKSPKNNFFVGLHINTNLGQADFTEFSLGYVHAFNFKER